MKKNFTLKSTSLGLCLLIVALFVVNNAFADSFVFADFESDEIGTYYPDVQDAASDFVYDIVVSADPTGTENKALFLNSTDESGTNYILPVFDVALPEGVTVADLKTLTFDMYCLDENGSYNNIRYYVFPNDGSWENWGWSGWQCNPGVTTIDVIGGQENKEKWTSCSIDLTASIVENANYSTMAEWNAFQFSFGQENGSSHLYLDNIGFTYESSGDEGGDGDLTFEYEGLWYEVICEEETDEDGNVVSSTPTENCQIIAHEGTTYSGELTIPATASNGSHTYYVTRIDEAAFANSEISGHVVIPATILNVAKRAFENCTGITEVTYEYSETALSDENGESAADYSFGGCTGVITVNLNRDITLGSGTRHCSPFDYNTSITTVFIGENVTVVPNYMFRNNSTKTLRWVTIYAETPPDWRYNPFDVIATDDDGNKLAVLYVHEASLDAYKNYENPNANGDLSTYASIFGEENILPIEGVPEGITNVETETSAKVTGIYNLAGQRVNENAKGILIKDGKKVLVK